MAAHIGDILADGRQGQDHPGVVGDFGPVQTLIGVSLGLHILHHIVIVPGGHGAAAAGQADDHPLAAGGVHCGGAQALDEVAGGLVDGVQICHEVRVLEPVELDNRGVQGVHLVSVHQGLVLIGEGVVGGLGGGDGGLAVQGDIGADGVNKVLHGLDVALQNGDGQIADLHPIELRILIQPFVSAASVGNIQIAAVNSVGARRGGLGHGESDALEGHLGADGGSALARPGVAALGPLGENILRTRDVGGVVQQAVLQLIVLGQLLDGQRGDGDGKLVPSLDLPAVLGHGLILGLQFEVGVVLHLQRNIRQHAEAIACGIGDTAGVALIALAAGLGTVAAAIGAALGEGDRAGFRQIGRNAGLIRYLFFRTIFISTVNIVLVVCIYYALQRHIRIEHRRGRRVINTEDLVDIGRPPDDPDTRRIAGAQGLAGAGDVLLHIAGDLTLEGVYLGDSVALVVGGDLDAIVAVLEEDGHVAAFIGGVVGLDRSAVFVVLEVVIDADLGVGAAYLKGERRALRAVVVGPVVVFAGVAQRGEVRQLLVQILNSRLLGTIDMDGNLRDLTIEIARLIRKGDGEGGGARLLGHQVILHGRSIAKAAQAAVLIDALHFLDLEDAVVLDVELQDAGQRIGQTLFTCVSRIERSRTVRPDLPEHGGIIGVLMPQVQIIVVGTHHEVVVIFRGLADGAAVQNGLLVDGAVRSLVGRHDCGVFRRVNVRKLRTLCVGQLQILHLGLLHGVVILGIVFCGHFPGKGVHQVDPVLNAVLVTLFQLLHPGHGILQLFHRLGGQLCLFLVGKSVISALIAHDDLVVLGIRQIIGARQSADKIGQLRRSSLDHNHRNSGVDLDFLILTAGANEFDYRFILFQGNRFFGKRLHDRYKCLPLGNMNLTVH